MENNKCGQLIHAADGSSCANEKPCKWHDYTFCANTKCEWEEGMEMVQAGHLHLKEK
jgi:hypothetical protein